MVIGYDAKRLFTNFTGLGNYSRNLVMQYHDAHREDELVLFTPRITEDPRTFPFIGDKFQIVQPKGFKPFWRNLDVVSDIKGQDVQIFHGLSHELPIGLSKLDIGKVVTIHDLIFRYYPDDYSWIDRQIYHAKWRHACKVADVVIAISEQTKNDIIKHYKIPAEKIRVIYQAADPVFSKQVTTDDVIAVKKKYSLPPVYNLSVGSVISRKNLLNIVRAMIAMPERERLPLVIIGNGKAYKKKIIEEAERNNVGHLLIWKGSPAFEDFPAIYKDARMMIYPSFHEGFGLPVIEAMHTGIPVITSNQSSLQEAGGDAAFLINPADPLSIRDAMIKLQSDEELRKDLVERGFRHIMKFEPSGLVRQLHEVYRPLAL